jgi:acyl-CoA dehydrogenase
MVGSVRALAAHCASSALVLAMHSIEAFILARYGTTPELKDFSREVVTEKLLIANANSEVGIGGDAGRSLCALDDSGAIWTIEKQAQAVSYGEYADVIVMTARRNPDAGESDQVLVLVPKGDVEMEALSDWDTLGLRGTCSRGFRLQAKVNPGNVFPAPFATIANDGGSQARQLLLSAVWIGLAEAAGTKAHEYVRAAARKSVGTVPPSALRLAEITADLHMARSLLSASVSRFMDLDARDILDDISLTVALKNMKVSSSTMGVKIATAALGICGISGYQRKSPFALDRIIRDAHGGVIMVNNDRYFNDNALVIMARKQL